MFNSVLFSKLVTLFKLGPHNLVWAVYYRVLLKLGVVTKHMNIKVPIAGPFFHDVDIELIDTLDDIELNGFGWFGYVDSIPDWNKALVSGKVAELSGQKLSQTHWSNISDFDLNVGDVKTVWEMSRFDWVLAFAARYLKTGDEAELDKLNGWLADWCIVNPTNAGINWKCGQEASIRVMHLCLVALLLKQIDSVPSSLLQLLQEHLERIEPTILYAMAQDNNHGTSEATALFIGGAVLTVNGINSGNTWSSKGRKWLENRARRLIENDGSFSQYSVNYHRVMLDTLSLCEVFRRELKLPEFSERFYRKLKAATNWLYQMTDSATGNVPNIGANDGARLLQLTATDYRDFRPSVQLASALFCNEFKYPVSGQYQQTVSLLLPDIELPVKNNIESKYFADGGYLCLAHDSAKAFFRIPKFKFRPGQADVFHLDFWFGGDNVLRDGGSYSYNSGDHWLKYFSGIESHNSVQFDDLQPMRKLSRFLYGDWIQTKVGNLNLGKNESSVEASYKTYLGAEHNRALSMNASSLTVVDKVFGFSEKATLRWRLAPGDWILSENTISNDLVNITIESSENIKRIEITEGFESRYYLQKTTLPVIEVEVDKASTITTLIKWNN